MGTTNNIKRDTCAQVGPRGGWCKRTAQVANGYPLDFCAKHNQMVRDGVVLMCRKCGGVASTGNQSR